jgi:hypothetical protein
VQDRLPPDRAAHLFLQIKISHSHIQKGPLGVKRGQYPNPAATDAAAVSRQVHLALFYDAQLDIKAMGHSQ